ncbi:MULTISPECIES: VOC family protein [Pseudoalteromonas]|uniref:Putative lactoylglutathione lyase n=1 Tax=Pseudoalteromonas luteoviolacea (strain 2ta16) TaxID=1353533 RepID=V4HT48_PSEL2|nr:MULTISPECIES: VOC family protein [Pseudoalteromonas]ESP93985.1 putative lactoylglutathione lyase [Pseudoalteromonas luteoviolacea 2ta16]KZN33525.1 glyoxalase [Pseudoalteromonas luteoviolacea NCIMB 1944]MCG7548984.1 VOC family protein [Pseudoalteromonas sp. Of7M-16]
MIGYVTLGTNDLQKGAKFYDELLAKIGATRFMEFETFISWSIDPEKPKFSIAKPFDGNTATIGNGVMIALAVENPQQVDMLYAKALELGATNEGAPGPRGDHFYGAYFRDLDGNKLNFFCMV